MSAFDQLATWPAPLAAAGVTDAHDTVADGGDIDHVHPWASVTKLVTTYGLLRLVELGDVDLDEAAGPAGSTVRHLLAHASGLNLEGSAAIAPPGRRRIYSNGGFKVLGELIVERSGKTLVEYLTAAVFQPLGMAASTIAGDAAAGGCGSVRDLLAFARELLAPTLVDSETLSEARSVAFPDLDGVLPGFGRCNPNDWGLGFEIRDDKDPHWTGRDNSPSTFGHFGRQGSFVWVDPAFGLACIALTGVEFGAWAAQAWPAFSDAIVAEHGLPGSAPAATHPTRPVM